MTVFLGQNGLEPNLRLAKDIKLPSYLSYAISSWSESRGRDKHKCTHVPEKSLRQILGTKIIHDELVILLACIYEEALATQVLCWKTLLMFILLSYKKDTDIDFEE